jgi:hypothetical protein
VPFLLGPPARVEIRRSEASSEVLLHASVHPLTKAALAVWLAVWAVVEALVLGMALGGTQRILTPFFFAAWLAGWTGIGLAAAWVLAWCFKGHERLGYDGQTFSYRLAVGPLGWTWRLGAGSVKGPWLRTARGAPADALGERSAQLGFDYRWWSYQLRSVVTERDGRAVVEAMRRGMKGSGGA